MPASTRSSVRFSAACLLGLTLPAVAGAQAAVPQSDSECEPRSTSVAVGEAVGVNLLVNRFDVWALGMESQRVNVESWSRNLQFGWAWDENSFSMNMLAHPIHGSTYFNAGRSNCLSFVESVPLAFLGSWTWEYFGEVHRPSLNDFFMTTLGGIALGEMTHRVAMTIRDEEATGSERVAREVLATLVNPVSGINRLVRGQWKGVRSNPEGHIPDALDISFKVGARRVFSDSALACREVCGTLLFDLEYGDPLDQTYTRPFDVFKVHAQLSPEGGGVNALEATGRLYQTELNRPGSRNRYALAVTQRYAYNTYTPLVSYGAQSIEVGAIARRSLGRNWLIHGRLAGDLVVMGAVSDEQHDVLDRDYAFGPGAGLILDVSLWRDRTRYLSLTNRVEYLHTVSGVSNNHVVSFSRLEAAIPFDENVGVGLAADLATRTTQRSGIDDETHDFADVRLFLSWRLH